MRIYLDNAAAMGAATPLRHLLEKPPEGVEYFYSARWRTVPALEKATDDAHALDVAAWSPTDWLTKVMPPFHPRSYYRFPRAVILRGGDLRGIDVVESKHFAVSGNTPLVIASDNLWSTVPLTRLGKGLAEKLLFSRRCRKIVLHSEFARRSLEERVRVPSEKVEVIPHLVEPREVEKNAAKKSSAIDFLFVGNWFEKKGGVETVEAFARLHERFPETRLRLVTREDTIPEKTRRVMEGCGAMTLSGPHSLEEMHALYAAADAFCMPSHWETFGVAPVEAMFFGLPLVLSDAGALPEKCVDGENGFLCRPKDVDSLYGAMEKLLDAGTRRRLGAASRQLFEERFSPEETRRHMKAVYEEAAKR